MEANPDFKVDSLWQHLYKRYMLNKLAFIGIGLDESVREIHENQQTELLEQMRRTREMPPKA